MTVLDLLLTFLPETYVDRVVSNVIDKKALHEEAFDISAEMLSLFDWNTSREGYDFWDKVLDAIESNKPLPPIPMTIDYAPNTHFVLKNDQWAIMNAGGLGLNMVFDFDKDQLKSLKSKYKYDIFLSYSN
jgi:hypothetical protein